MEYRLGGMAACSAGAAESVPTYLLLLDVSSPLSVPVSRLPQHRDRVPCRCGLRAYKAQRVKAAQEVAGSGRGALVLALTVVLDSSPRTGGTSVLPRAMHESTPELAKRKKALQEDPP
jgi:hypothetical protein